MASMQELLEAERELDLENHWDKKIEEIDFINNWDEYEPSD